MAACCTVVATSAIIGPLLRAATTTAPTTYSSASLEMSTLRTTTPGHAAFQSAASKNNYKRSPEAQAHAGLPDYAFCVLPLAPGARKWRDVPEMLIICE